MSARQKTSNKESVEALLSDLDNLGIDETFAVPPISPQAADNQGDAPSSAMDQQGPPVKEPDTAHQEASPTRTGLQEAATAQSAGVAVGDDAQSLLDDLDSLVQRRAPTPRKTSASSEALLGKLVPQRGERSEVEASETKLIRPSSSVSTLGKDGRESAHPFPSDDGSNNINKDVGLADDAGPSKGWGGWWSSAAKLADQARAEIERRARSEQAKELSQRGWHLAQGMRGYVKETGWERLGEDLGRVGKRGWTEVINAVAPPIAAHEVIQVNLSHDMVGFDGVPDVTFKVLSRVMESQQVGMHGVDQQLVVNKAPERKGLEPEEAAKAVGPSGGAEDDKDTKAVRGFAESWRCAEDNLSKLIGTHEPERTSKDAAMPVTYCPVFVRIQACFAPLPGLADGGSASDGRQMATVDNDLRDHLYFLVLLQDPNHGLTHRSVSQSLPAIWLSMKFEENSWIEHAMVDALEGALGVAAQGYVNGRQSGSSRNADTAGS